MASLSIFFALLASCLLFYFYIRMQKEIKKRFALEKDQAQLKQHLILLQADKRRLEEKESQLDGLRDQLMALKVKEGKQEVALVEQKRFLEDKLCLLKEAELQFSHAFKALSADALEKSQRSFLNLAQETLGKFQEGAKGDLDKRQASIEAIIKPVQASLSELDKGMRALEKERKGENEALKVQLKSIMEAEQALRFETASLVKALRTPIIRGQWGELQLKRVVELAGLVNHCDFYSQQTTSDGQLRPDLVVHLPGNKQVVVDAKTPCHAYLEAIQSNDEEEKNQQLKRHAKQVRTHVQLLAKKAYWQNFTPTPEFVVLFIPSDNFFTSALEHDPSLIEVGVKEGVVIATPTTLIGLLRAIAYGWKQDTLSRHAREISLLGHELYKRLADMSMHFRKVGKSLSNSVDAYNQTIGSFKSRVLVSARKLKDWGAAAEGVEINSLPKLEEQARVLESDINNF